MSSFLNRQLALVVALVALPAALAPAQDLLNPTFGLSGLALPIPPAGSGGGASSPTNTFSVDIDAAAAGTVDNMGVFLTLNHTYCADLIITLSHCGTSVVLSDGNFGTTARSTDYGGSYEFRDDATVSINDAPTTAGVMNPGAYLPDNPLSAFNGMNAAGRWTLTIYDRLGGDTGTLDAFGFYVELEGEHQDLSGLPAPVPPTGTYGTFTQDFTFSGGGRVGGVSLQIDMDHSYAGDLLFTLSHNGVTRRIMDSRTGGIFSPNLAGAYRFFEGLGVPTTANVSGGNLAPGDYGFLDSMSPFYGAPINGTWTLTIEDRVGADAGTLRSARLLFSRQGYTLEASQPNGNVDLTVTHRNGARAGNAYFSPWTLTPGNFPNGWFYGLDITLPELFALYNSGLPTILGYLDNCVQQSFTLVYTLPGGINFHLTSIELEGPIVRQQIVPFIYTTVP